MKLIKELKNIFIRYFLLLVLAFPHLEIFYFIFAPLTIYPVYFLFKLFFVAHLTGDVLVLSHVFSIELIGACIAGSAYYLLFALNLSIPNIKLWKRTKMILFSFASLLIINILRIFFLSLLYVNDSQFFELFHKILWYFGSILLIVLIWFVEVKIFGVKEIPFYSDLMFFWKLRKKAKNTKASKKN